MPMSISIDFGSLLNNKQIAGYANELTGINPTAKFNQNTKNDPIR